MLKKAMQSDLPDDEAHRLAALHDKAILDTPRHASFDALARLAAQLADTPVAYIGLLDRQRLWFKASVGLDLSELPRDAGQTAPALPDWAFHASVPLCDDTGLVLGTLGVAAPQARSLGPTQQAALQQSLSDLACVAHQAIEAHAQSLALARQAITDPITGLSNRAHFDQALGVELAHAMRRGEPFTVLYMDLDGFKEVNDGFGHAAGVEVLREVAQRLTQQVRLGDVIARFGIDEFGVVMRHGGDQDAQVLARRIVKAVAQPITLSSGDVVGVGISVGMAAYDDDVASVRALMQNAEQALYQVKKQNERRWKTFMGLH